MPTQPDKLLDKIETLSRVLDQDTLISDKYFHGVVLGLLIAAHNDILAGAVLDRAKDRFNISPIIDTMWSLIDAAAN